MVSSLNKSVEKPKKVYQECVKLYKQHSLKSLNLDLDQFEECLNKNSQIQTNISGLPHCDALITNFDKFEKEIEMHLKILKERQISMNGVDRIPSSTKVQFNNLRDNLSTGRPHEHRNYAKSIYRSYDFGSHRLIKQNNRTSSFNADPNASDGDFKKLKMKLSRFQEELGKKSQSETHLQEEVKRLNIELASLRKVQQNNKFYEDLKQSISNISEAIFNSSKNVTLKDEHRILLKGLLDDSFELKIDELETRNGMLLQNIQQLCAKLKIEIKRNNESCLIAKKYISNYQEVIKNAANDFESPEL